MTVYLDTPVKTKKALKEKIAAGERVGVHDPSIFGDGSVKPGEHALCGPSEYDRKWYATVLVNEGGYITKVVA